MSRNIIFVLIFVLFFSLSVYEFMEHMRCKSKMISVYKISAWKHGGRRPVWKRQNDIKLKETSVWGFELGITGSG
jgi:hypothetical protein